MQYCANRDLHPAPSPVVPNSTICRMGNLPRSSRHFSLTLGAAVKVGRIPGVQAEGGVAQGRAPRVRVESKPARVPRRLQKEVSAVWLLRAGLD